MQHPWGVRFGPHSSGAASSLFLGSSPVWGLHLLEVREKAEFWPSFYNQPPNEPVCLGLPWILTPKERAGPSPSSWKQQLWVSCAEEAVAKLHLAFDLGVLSQEVVWELLPRGPSGYLSQAGRIYWSALGCTAHSTSAHLDLSWSKKMANYSQCYNPSSQVGVTLGCQTQVPAWFLLILCNCPHTLSL